MSFVLSPDRVDEQLLAACPNAAATDMARAQAAALRALGVQRIALVTPSDQRLEPDKKRCDGRREKTCIHLL